MSRKRIIESTVPRLKKPQPLNAYLAGRFTYFTQQQWMGEILAGKITIDGEEEIHPDVIVHGGETLAYDGSDIVEPEVDDNISILYEDDALIAVNKTGNLPVHPSGRYFNHTLTAILEERLGRKVFPAHRIDRETSGVILLAFDSAGADALAASLASGCKEYLALVHGVFPDGELTMDWPLGKDHASEIGKKRKAGPQGTETAVTRFRRVLCAGNISLVRCFPQTGRLHQIRAHLEAAGFPIVGDKLYGRDKSAFLEFIRNGLTDDLQKTLLLPRSALHAARLVFAHPKSGQRMILRAPLHKMFTDFIRKRRTGPE